MKSVEQAVIINLITAESGYLDRGAAADYLARRISQRDSPAVTGLLMAQRNFSQSVIRE